MTKKPFSPSTTVPDLSKDPTQVAAMFDRVAARYDLTNDVLSLGQVRVWRQATRGAVNAQAGQRVLDIAAGTGTSSVEFARDGAQVTAADFSAGMVAEGRRRHPELEFVEADAMNLPFGDDEFDAVTISVGLRNVQDPERALREMYRVAKPGGRLVVCEFSKPTWVPLRRLYEFYLRTALVFAARFVSSDSSAYGYLVQSILDWPSQRELGRMIARAGWSNVEYRNLTGGIVALHRATKK